MFDIEKTLSEFGLTPEKYEELLNDCSDKVHKIKDIDWSEISEKYNIGWNGDSIRKAQQPILLGGTFVSEYYKWKESQNKNKDDEDYLKEYQEMKRQLERAKIQYRDERNAWSKQNYTATRIDETLDILDRKLSDQGKINYDIHNTPVINSDNDLICILSDLHIGATFKSLWGEYSTDIAKERLNKYLNEILKIQKIHGSEKCYVSLQGDLISGSIRRTIQVSNKENVIEQVKIAIELIGAFCYELTKYFNHVYLSNVVGNHSRLIENKEDSIHDERLDDLIGWSVGKNLEHIENFHMLTHRKLDIGIADLCVRNKTYIVVHGDNDQFNKQGLLSLCSMIGFFPYACLYGHLHTPSYDEINGVKMIRSGSLCGSGDSYTIEKRLCGDPSQTVLVCSKNGIDCIYNINLK